MIPSTASRRILAASIAALLSPFAAQADLNWDTIQNNAVINGGTGVWDLVTPNWTTDGALNVPWDSTGAIFGATPGTVTINVATGGVSATSLTFNTAGYVIAPDLTDGSTADDTLTLTGAGGVITANADASIGAIIAGTVGLTKEGTGTLTLTSTVANTFTGAVNLNGGTLSVNALNKLGASGNDVFFANSATLQVTGALNPAAGTTNLTFGTGGGRLDITGVNTITLDDAGQFAGSGTVTKIGTGRLLLGGTSVQTFNGAILINEGVVEATTTNSFRNATGITLNTGGTFVYNSGTQTTFAGTGTAERILVPLTLAGGTLAVQGANHTFGGTVTLTAASTINGADFVEPRTARRVNLTGQVTGAADLTVLGTTTPAGTRGFLQLNNTTNNLSGTISLADNASLEAVPQTTTGVPPTIVTTGNVLGTATVRFLGTNALLDLRDSGTGPAQTFAYGNNVILDNDGNILVGTTNGVASAGSTFALGGLTVNGNRTLTLTNANTNALAFGGTTSLAGNLTVNSTGTPLTLGAITESGGARSLTKIGAAALTINGNAAHTGGTTLENGALTLTGASGQLSGAGAIAIRPGASLILDNSVATVADRVANGAPINLAAGTVSLISQLDTSVAEVLGPVSVLGGNTINTTRTGVAGNADLTLTSLTRSGNGTVSFTGTNLGTDGRIFITGQADSTFLSPWITTGTDFAQYTAAGGIAAITTYDVDPAEDQFLTGDNVRLTGATTTTLLAPRSINSLNFAGTATRTLAAGENLLTIESGGLLVNDATATLTSTGAGGVTAGTGGAAELIITDTGVNTAPEAFTLGATVRDNGAGVVTLVKSGTGRTILSVGNAHTGGTVINQGILQANVATSLGAAGADVTLAGGQLDLKNNSTASNTTFAYGQDVTVAANSTIDVNRLSGANTGVTLTLGDLAIGNQTLTVQGSNGYSLTMTGTATLSGIATFNPTTATFRLGGLTTGPGGFIKTGAGAMSLIGTVANDYSGLTTVTAGTLFLSKTPDVNAIAGDILINGGAINLSANNQIADTSTITVTSGTMRFGNGSTSTADETVGTINASGGAIDSGFAVPVGGSHTVNIGTANLTGNATYSQNSGSTWNIGTLSTASSGAFTINGNSLQQATNLVIGSGGVTLTGASINLNLGTTASTLGSRVTLNGNVTTLASATNSNIQLGSNTIGTRLLDLGGALRTFTIADGTAGIDLNVTVPIGGATGGGIVKNGDGLLRLDNRTSIQANTFDGGVDVNAGTLEAFGPAAATTSVLGTGTLTLSGGVTSLRSNGTGSNGTIDFGNNVVVDGNARLNVDREGANTGNTIQLNTLSIGAQTLEITGANTYSARFAGATTLTGNATFQTTSANLTLAGAVGGNFSITKTGASTLILGTDNTFNGLDLTAGIVQANGPAAASTTALGTGLVTLRGGTTLNLRNDGLGDNGTVAYGNAVLIDPLAASTTINVNRLGATAVGNTLTLGALTIGASAANPTSNTLNVTGGNTYQLAFTGVTTLTGATVFSPTTATLRLSNAITGGFGFTKAGSGTLVLEGAANTYTGVTTANAGILLLGKAADVNAIPGTLNIATSAGSSPVVRLSANEQIANTSVVNISTPTNLQSAVLDLAGFTETIGGLSISSNTGGSAGVAAAVTTGATGTLILNGDIVFNNDRNATANTAREVLITGTGNRDSGPVRSGTLDLGGATRTITVNAIGTNANQDASIDTAIINGGIIKEGAKGLILNGDGTTFAGGIQVNNGFIRASGSDAATSSALGTGTVTLAAAGTQLQLVNGGAVSGGSTVFGNDVVVQADATINVNRPAGSASTDNTLVLDDLSIGANVLTVSGANGFDLAVDAVTLTGDATFAVTSANSDFNVGSITGGFGITKLGASTLALSGAAAHTGNTDISGGTLRVGISGSISGSPRITVATGATFDVAALVAGFNVGPAQTVIANGAVTGALVVAGTLGGEGSVSDAVTISGGGRLAPGNDLGTLAIGNTLAFANNSTLAIELGGDTPGDGFGFYDQVNMTNAAGSVSLGTNITLNLALANGFVPNGPTDFFILTREDAGSFGLSQFAGFAEGAAVNLGDGITGTITYLANWTGTQAGSFEDGGNDIALLNVIPEPGSAISLLAGLASLLGLQRFRRRL